METLIPGKTAWETHQYQLDHGRRAAVIQARRDFADFLEADEESPLPPGADTAVGVLPSQAAVDRWAARHHVTPSWRHGTYRASVSFGTEFGYCVVYIPPDVLAGRLDAQDSAQATPELAEAAA